MRRLVSALAAGAVVAVVVAAAQEHGMHGAAAAGYAEANAAMHEAMAIDYSGDPDIDFARSMIPQHEGAIAMAEVLLANGKDPELRRRAAQIVGTEQGEIAFLEQWLAVHDK